MNEGCDDNFGHWENTDESVWYLQFLLRKDNGKMNKKIEVYYICSNCAKENGGIWPDGHVATFNESECESCGEKGFLAHVSDWNWPNGSPKGWCANGLWD